MFGNPLKYGKYACRAGLLAGTVAGVIAIIGPAQATTVAYDLGTATATSPGGTTAVCNSPGTNPCVFGDQSGVSNQFTAGTEMRFTDITSGAVLGADAYNLPSGTTGTGTWVTQKKGTFGTSETGIGQSTSGTSASDSDGEITSNTYVLLRPVSANYAIAGVWITSMQIDEGAKIYGYTGTYSSTSLDTTQLTLLNTFCGGNGSVHCTQTTSSSNPNDEVLLSANTVTPPSPSATVNANLSSYNPIVNAALATFSAIVVTAFGTGGSPADVAISSIILTSTGSSGGASVPEPASFAVLATGILGLSLLRRRRA